MEASPKGEMSKEEGWIQIRNRKGKDLSTSQEVRSEREPPLTLGWGDKREEEEGRKEGEVRQNNPKITMRSPEFDDDKVPSSGGSVGDLVTGVNDSDEGNSAGFLGGGNKREEQMEVRKSIKRDRQLKNLQFSVNYDRNGEAEGRKGAVVVSY